MMKFKYILVMLILFIWGFKVSAYESYIVGDEVEYNGHNFHVIENSDDDNDTILLLLKDYVSYEELMSLDIENKDQIDQHGAFTFGSLGASYENSYIKTVVDAWSNKLALKPNHIKESGLLKYDYLIDNLGYEDSFTCTSSCYYVGFFDNVPEWFKSNDSSYFTMSNVGDSTDVWMISINGTPVSRSPLFACKLKPVIRLYKSALTDAVPEESEDSNQDIIDTDTRDTEKSETVKVPDTLQMVSILFIMIGVVIISISIFSIMIKRRESTK